MVNGFYVIIGLILGSYVTFVLMELTRRAIFEDPEEYPGYEETGITAHEWENLTKKQKEGYYN